MRTLFTFLIASLFTLSLSAQSVGPDVTVSSLTDVQGYGTAQGITAFAVGTVACNVGNTPVTWNSGNNQHPVIAQNMYQLINGRFQQIGMSWLKHGFVSTNSPGCGSCTQPPLGGGQLGVGCTDAYGAGLNGSQGYLGPRSQVNAATGYYPMPHGSPTGDSTIAGRVQVLNTDLGNAATRYFVEAQYVTADDATANNDNNNATWQEVQVPSVGLNGGLPFVGPVHAQQPVLYAWQAVDASVSISTFDIDGRFFIAKKVTSLGGGLFHWEIAVENLNSDRSGGGFTVNFAPGTVISNPGFRSIPYHSGEPYVNTPWTASINANSIHWQCALSANGNALRWGMTDNFWFNATASGEVSKTIDPFKPATPCPADPSVPGSSGYTLNTGAAFDNPTLTSPTTIFAGPTTFDDSSTNVPIGFSFVFYGTPYTTVNVCTNGFLSFTSGATDYTNASLPNAGTGAMIAGLWDDLIIPPGSITRQTLGVAPNRRFVVSWNGIGHYGATGQLESFKIILDETTNKVTSTIVSSAGGGSSATRGVQDQSGTLYTQASFNTGGSAVANTSQTYTPFNSIIPSALMTVAGSTGPNGTLVWNINSNAGLAPVVIVASLDPGPTNLGPLGVLNFGLASTYAAIADGYGYFYLNPNDVTDWYCGDFSVSVPLGPSGLPPGLTIYTQGVVFTTTSVPLPPNGQFHITTAVTINT